MADRLLEFFDDGAYASLVEQLGASDSHKILRKIIFPKVAQNDIRKIAEYQDYSIHRGIYLDTETTGLKHEFDEVIQICILPFIFGKSPDGDKVIIFGVYEPYIGFNEPSKPLSQEVIDLTGITPEMLEGQSLDIEKIENYVGKSELIIAHNSQFDRPFCHQISEIFMQKDWACSLTDINWKKHGFESRKLGHIAADMGYYFEAHRADADCYAGLACMIESPDDDINYFNQLYLNAQKETITIRAQYAPFDKKDVLKERGYRWQNGEDGLTKGWETIVSSDDYNAEIEWLEAEVYEGKSKHFEKRQTALTRFY